ncbi:MAG: ATP-binding protein [Ignavibacteria bacterium]|nr:ATP-binding protein [Ignavibacteria bacterium]
MHKEILTLKSERNEIMKFENLLDQVNEIFGLEEEKFINLKIACSEALINAIVHGNKEDHNKKVYTEIIYDSAQIMIRILDEGKGFILSSIPDPTSDDNLLKESGRGIFIIKSLVDNFICNSTDTGTEFVLKCYK